MENFVNLLNSRDARWILDVDELPENYEGEDLQPVVNDLMREDEVLSGNPYYTDYIKKESYKTKLESDIIILTTFQMCLKWGLTDDAFDILAETKFKYKTWEEANRKVLSIQQRILISNQNQKSQKSDAQLNYGQMIANLVYWLKITPYNMTVAQYRAHEKQSESIQAQNKSSKTSK